MYGGPGQATSLDLSLPFIERAELLVVLIEVGEEFFKDPLDLGVNPGAIAQFDY